MKAHERINRASYGPEALMTMTRAFDQAWSVVAGNISQDASQAARLRLANALLSVATDDSRDVVALKRKALEAMALSYYAVPSDTFTSDATGHEDAGQQPHLAKFPAAQSWPALRPAETLNWLVYWAGSPNKLLGTVIAPTLATALASAFKDFNVTPMRRKRIMVRQVDGDANSQATTHSATAMGVQCLAPGRRVIASSRAS
jgi:hypothetical protein